MPVLIPQGDFPPGICGQPLSPRTCVELRIEPRIGWDFELDSVPEIAEFMKAWRAALREKVLKEKSLLLPRTRRRYTYLEQKTEAGYIAYRNGHIVAGPSHDYTAVHSALAAQMQRDRDRRDAGETRGGKRAGAGRPKSAIRCACGQHSLAQATIRRLKCRHIESGSTPSSAG